MPDDLRLETRMSSSGPPLPPDIGTRVSESPQIQFVHPLLGISSIDPLGLGITWHNRLDTPKLLSLVDHHVPLPGVFPAAGYVKMVAEASLKLCGSRVFRKFELDDFFIQNELTLGREEDRIELNLELQSTGSHERHGDRTDFLNFRIRTTRSDATTPQLNALGCIRLRSSDGHGSLSAPLSTLPEHPHPPSNNNDTTTLPSQSNIIKTLPMSYGQSGFWFMTQLMEDPTFFNGTVTFLILTKSPLDTNLVAQIVQDMGTRHQGLRTAFFSDPQSHQPKQSILASSPLRLETKPLTSPAHLRAEIDATNRHVYNLSRGETLRLILLTESPTRHHLIIGYHHINTDGMSIIALIDDLRLSYGNLPLPLPYQQPQFALLQRQRLQTGHYAPDIAFWKSTFHPSLPPILPLLPLSPFHLRSRPQSRTTYRHVRAERRLPHHITTKLNHLRQHNPLTAGSPFPLYITIFQILLSRLTNDPTLCLGIASANRHNDPSSLSSIGIFLNLIPLYLQSPLSQPFLSLLQQTKSAILAALKHSSLPFDVLLDEVSAPRTPAHTPLFQAFVNYIPVRENQVFGKDDGEINTNQYEIGETMYDVMLAVIDPPLGTGDPWVAIMVQRELYSEREAGVLLDCFVNLMDAFTGNVGLLGNAPGMFGGEAVGRAVELGRGEEVDFGDGGVMGLLDGMVAGGRGGDIALRDMSGGVVSYGEMMSRSVMIAGALLKLGVSRKSRVGMLQEPTVDWICSMLGIWRFGGSYVPLEVTQGVGRLKSIVNDGELAAVLVHGATRSLCDEIGVGSETVILDVDTVRGDAGQPGSATSSELYNPGPEDEAIVLYTSGSTGVPKGISLPHRMVTNSINGFLHAFPMKPQTVLQQIALSFDVSWWQTLVGLATGGSVIVAGKEARRDPFALTALIVSQGITLTLAVPSEATSWLQHGDLNQLRDSSWEWHISAGEEIGRNLVEKIRAVGKPGLRFVNAYGPTETIIPHAYEIPYRDSRLPAEVPIGKVLPNYSVYIIDQDGHHLPAGVPGQIVIAGAGVASGYIKQPELTAARFPRDRLASERAVANGWTRAHLSGDRGYMREDGVFVTLGRMNGDTQVKLRGQRFELREVEGAIVAAGGGEIQEAVCHIRRRDETDAASAFLVVHVVLAPDAQRRHGGTNGAAVDSRMREIISGLALPQYMRPSVVVSLPSIPLNHHGKIDRKFLYKAPLRNIKIPDEAPLTQNQRPSPKARMETVNEMEEIWRDVLGDLIGSDQRLDQGSDFFLVGGSSLLLIKVRGKIKERTSQDIPLVNLFEHSTLGKMTAMLDARSTRAASRQPQYDESEETPKNERQPGSQASQARMKQIWLLVLGDIVTADQIGPQSDFFLVGGNSLLLISIQRQVNKEFGFLLPLAKLFESSTLAQMAALLDRTLVATQNDGSSINAGADLVNWEQEVAFKEIVPANFMAAATGKIHAHRPPPGGMIVVLTGATGFLGRHILSQLVVSPMVKVVHCIAVRDVSKAKLLIDSPKVVIHYGDLRDSRLGLSEDIAMDIFSSLSAIIHNGADVSFLRGYRTIRAANILSTRTLAQFAMKYYTSGKPSPHFHFVSTAGVVQLGTRELYEESLPAQQPPENSNGYVASKWASEKYLENAFAASGLPVTIHRPSYVLGPDAPRLDVMHNILHFAEKLRSVPTMPPVDRWLQFVGIREVARDIAADVLSEMSETSGQAMKGVKYRNHCGEEENWVRLDQLGPYLERQHPGGNGFQEVAFQDWIQTAGEAGMPIQVKEYLSNLVMNNTSTRSWIYPRVLKGKGPRNTAGPWRRHVRL